MHASGAPPGPISRLFDRAIDRLELYIDSLLPLPAPQPIHRTAAPILVKPSTVPTAPTPILVAKQAPITRTAQHKPFTPHPAREAFNHFIITELAFGRHPASASALAKRFGVSNSTVSRWLSQLRAQGLLAPAKAQAHLASTLPTAPAPALNTEKEKLYENA